MTDFYTLSGRPSRHDGAGGMQRSSSSHNQKAYTGWMVYTSPQSQFNQRQPGSQSSSSSNSSVKAKQRMTQHIPSANEEGDRCSGLDDILEFQDNIAAFPTNNQPVMDSTLKDMLVSLRSAIHTDMLQLMKQCKSEVNEVRNRVTHIESKMGEFTETFNSMVDAHNEHEDDIVWLKSKVADLEDRFRRNNIKIRGIPKTIKTSELTAFLTNIMKEALPELPLEELVIDRIHRLPKHIPEKLPRDTIARIHYYRVKEKLMSVTRRTGNLPDCMQGLSFC